MGIKDDLLEYKIKNKKKKTEKKYNFTGYFIWMGNQYYINKIAT